MKNIYHNHNNSVLFFAGKLLIFILTTGICLIVFAIGSQFFFGNILNVSFALFLYVLFMVITCLLCWKFLNEILQRAVNKISEQYASESLSEIEMARKKIVSLLPLTELANLVVNTLTDVLSLKNISLHVLNDEGKTFHAVSSYGFSISESQSMKIDIADLIITIASKKKNVLIREEMFKTLSWEDSSDIVHSFVKLQAQYVFPIMFDDEVIGLLNVSHKRNDKKLSRDELRHVARFCRTLGLALHNARTFSSLSKEAHDLKNVNASLLQNAKMSAIEQLAAGIAHEIHNPLTIISGKAQVLLLKKGKQYEHSRVEEVLRTIVEQTKRAADITRRLLMFSKPQDEASNRLINIENVLSDTISLVSYQISLDDIRIVKVIESNIPAVGGSLVEARELFLNLILNAIQAIGKKGVITITVQCVEKDEIVKISVADTGRGIDEKDLPLIFDPFYTNRPESVGLGLFVCQQIVNRFGGCIKVESKLDVGSIFVITIPLTQKSVGKGEGDFMLENKITKIVKKKETYQS